MFVCGWNGRVADRNVMWRSAAPNEHPGQAAAWLPHGGHASTSMRFIYKHSLRFNLLFFGGGGFTENGATASQANIFTKTESWSNMQTKEDM